MANVSLNDFLSGILLTRLADSPTIARGIPDFLPAEFSAVSAEKPPTTEVQWDAFNGNRQTAIIINSNSPSIRREMPGVTRKQATALGSRQHIVMDHARLIALKSDQPVFAAAAQRQMIRDMANFRSEFDTLRTQLRYSALALGTISYDTKGNILLSTSGAYNTINFGIPSANILTKTSTYPNITPTVTVGDWSSASTDIAGSLRALKDCSIFTSNYEVQTLLYGSSVPSYLQNNTSVQNYLSRNPRYSQKGVLEDNEIPPGLFGYNWIPMHKAYNVAASGAITNWWANNTVVAVPTVEETWYEYIEAGSLVPNGIASPNMDLGMLIDLCTIKNGRFSYSELSTDPIFAKVIMGDYTLPIIKNGLVYFRLTVS
jgi:hypothetical protein